MSIPTNKKFQATIHFRTDDEFMALVPPHRIYINRLIENGVIEFYSVSLESMRSWIIINAADKPEVEYILSQSPLYRYWTVEVDELYVYDAPGYRLPSFQLN
jgi:hypothetical protein